MTRCSPGLQWVAPFAGFTMAEYFRDRGQHALAVIDALITDGQIVLDVLRQLVEAVTPSASSGPA